MKFTRSIIKKIDFELNNGNKPLLVIGARQIGKTTSIRNYLDSRPKGYMYINLDSDAEAREIFEKDFDIERIQFELSLLYRISDFDTIFLDEIQGCPRAITALKYFQEQSSLNIVGSGLGLTINHFGHSFPVGKVKILEMYPMSFIEFLQACEEGMLLDIIDNTDFKQPINPTAHKLLLEQFDIYDGFWFSRKCR